jgi:hypothetical protein
MVCHTSKIPRPPEVELNGGNTDKENAILVEFCGHRLLITSPVTNTNKNSQYEQKICSL